MGGGALLWTWLGLLLICSLSYQYIKGKKYHELLLIGIIIILFSTFSEQALQLYKQLLPEDAGSTFHWISKTMKIQYSSDIVLLRWVFVQAVPAWLAVIMLLLEWRNVRRWGMIVAPLVLYSVFAFFGLFCLVLLIFIFEKLIFNKEWKRNIKSVFCLPNVIGGILLCVLTGYLFGNIIQPKPDDAGMSFTILHYGNYKTLLLLFEAAWMIWIPFLYRRKKENILLLSASILLLIFPFFSLGYFNDLCMRASIPPLFVFCILLMKNITDKERSKMFKTAALCLLIVCSSGGRSELSKAVQQSTIQDQNRCMTYKSVTEQIDAFPAAMYQYVDWNDSKISSLILR